MRSRRESCSWSSQPRTRYWVRRTTERRPRGESPTPLRWRAGRTTPMRRMSRLRPRRTASRARFARTVSPNGSVPTSPRCGRATQLGLDAARPDAVERRRARRRRTARENLADLVDEGSYVEYGPLLFAAQERRRAKDELIASTPADGLVAGVAEVDGNPCVAMSYDYTVLAGTQGMRGPPQEGPPVRAGRAAAPAGRAVCRGRRRPSRRCGLPDRGRTRLPRVSPVWPPQRPGAAGGDRLGLLLRGERCAARLL